MWTNFESQFSSKSTNSQINFAQVNETNVNEIPAKPDQRPALAFVVERQANELALGESKRFGRTGPVSTGTTIKLSRFCFRAASQSCRACVETSSWLFFTCSFFVCARATLTELKRPFWLLSRNDNTAPRTAAESLGRCMFSYRGSLTTTPRSVRVNAQDLNAFAAFQTFQNHQRRDGPQWVRRVFC